MAGRSGGNRRRVELSIAQVEADIARRQAEYRDLRARQERESRQAEDLEGQAGPSRVRVDFEELDRPFQVLTQPFGGSKEGATRG